MRNTSQGGAEGVEPGSLHASIRVVIPTLNEEHELPGAVASVLSGGAPARVVVSDGGSTDATCAVARELGATVVTGARGRGAQLARGAAGATEDVLVFLHADTRVPPGGLGAVLRALGDPAVAGGRFRVRWDWEHPVLRLAGWLTRFSWPLAGYGDQVLFARRSAYEAAGGFEDVPLFEDVRFYRRLRAVGRVRIVPLSVTSSARRFRERGVLRQVATNLRVARAHQTGSPPHRLIARYEGNAR